MVRETRELVRDRLATHLIVEFDVLKRERCLGPERPEYVDIVVGEWAPAARHRDYTMRASVRFERPERDRGDTHGSRIGLTDPAVLQCGALRFLHDVFEACQRPLAAGLGERLLVAQTDAEPTAAALHRVDRRLQRELEQRRAIETRGERVADATNRLLEPHALSGQLVKPARQLARHAVELHPERRELVAALDPDGRREVAASESSRRLEKAAEPALKSTRCEQREAKREHEERDDQHRGDYAAATKRGGGGGQRRQNGDGHASPAEARERLAGGAIALAPQRHIPVRRGRC